MRSLVFAVLAASAAVVATPFNQEVYVAKVDFGQANVPGPDRLHLGPKSQIDLSKYTIGQILNWTLHHPEKEPEHKKPGWWPFPSPEKRKTLPIHRIAWLVSKADEHLKEKLFDEEAQLTFLAPDDDALTPPHRRGGPPHHGPPHHGPPPPKPPHHGPPHREPPQDVEAVRPNPLSMPEMFEDNDMDMAEESDDDDDDDKKEKRRRFFRKLLAIILRYHILPDEAYILKELGDKSTVRTALPFSRKEGEEHFRVRVRPNLIPKPGVRFNVYSHSKFEVRAKNGIIHLVSAPLLPPLSPLSEAFLLPGLFSTLTSGVQKAELDEVLTPWLHGHKDDDEGDDERVHDEVTEVLRELVEEHVAKEGPRDFTVFAPTNFAFKRLGWKVNAFLFSPFGRRALKKVLAYHVVPDAVLFTDYGYNSTEKTEEIYRNDLSDEEVDVDRDVGIDMGELFRDLHPLTMDDDVAFRGKAKVHYATLKTLVPEATLEGKVVEYRPFGDKGPLVRDAFVKGASNRRTIKVFLPDLPAWRGAIHVINSVLIPPFCKHHEGHDIFEL